MILTIAVTMSDADFETAKKLQAERNTASAGKKGSKTFDPSNQRTDVSTKASLTESFDTSHYERVGGDKFAGYNTSFNTPFALLSHASPKVNHITHPLLAAAS